MLIADISENLLAIAAPLTTKCHFCLVLFCSIIAEGCMAVPLAVQRPHGYRDVADLIQSSDVYDCFDQNTFEVELLLDYLSSQSLTPAHVYREVCIV